MSIRLLIVDDQELVRTGFRLFLETQTTSRSSARQARASRRSSAPENCDPTSS
jgi:DNA-binding NarL/FixJ family response regulator